MNEDSIRSDEAEKIIASAINEEAPQADEAPGEPSGPDETRGPAETSGPDDAGDEFAGIDEEVIRDVESIYGSRSAMTEEWRRRPGLVARMLVKSAMRRAQTPPAPPTGGDEEDGSSDEGLLAAPSIEELRADFAGQFDEESAAAMAEAQRRRLTPLYDKVNELIRSAKQRERDAARSARDSSEREFREALRTAVSKHEHGRELYGEESPTARQAEARRQLAGVARAMYAGARSLGLKDVSWDDCFFLAHRALAFDVLKKSSSEQAEKAARQRSSGRIVPPSSGRSGAAPEETDFRSSAIREIESALRR